jgi:V8-like Glu-specific endopeptidase
MVAAIPDTTAYPWRTIAEVEATFPNGSAFVGSGVLADENSVLTAAHVVYRATDGGAAINVVVTPGLDGTRTPFGAFEVYGGFFFTGFDLDRNDLLTNADSAQDAAVLSFDTDIGSTTGWMGHATPDLVGGTANLTGYPAKTLSGQVMHTDSGVVLNNRDGTLDITRLFHEPGNSGGPVWIDLDPGPGLDPRVIGIVSSTVAAFSLDSVNFPAIRERIQGDDVLLPDRLVDREFYLSTYPDVRDARISPKEHYLDFGWREGRDPNAFLDGSAYLDANPDVRAAGHSPLEHYRDWGWKERRDPGPGFDIERYLAANPDVRAAGMDPLTHYLTYGRAEGRRGVGEAVGREITGGFDAEHYLFHNPDVARSGMDPRQHFDQSGWREGRQPNGWFDTAGYLAAYVDVRAAGFDPLAHYMTHGWREGRDPDAAKFDTSAYLAAYADVRLAGLDPLSHYLQHGYLEGRQTFGDGAWT